MSRHAALRRGGGIRTRVVLEELAAPRVLVKIAADVVDQLPTMVEVEHDPHILLSALKARVLRNLCFGIEPVAVPTAGGRRG